MTDFDAPRLAFHHVGLSVPDLEAAIAWYGEMLGFIEEHRFALPPADAKVAFVRRGDLRVELFEVNGAAALPDDRRYPNRDLRTHGTKHVAFRVDDLDTFLAEMERRGADVAMIVPRALGRACFLRDCAGNLVEFLEDQVLP